MHCRVTVSCCVGPVAPAIAAATCILLVDIWIFMHMSVHVGVPHRFRTSEEFVSGLLSYLRCSDVWICFRMCGRAFLPGIFTCVCTSSFNRIFVLHGLLSCVRSTGHWTRVHDSYVSMLWTDRAMYIWNKFGTTHLQTVQHGRMISQVSMIPAFLPAALQAFQSPSAPLCGLWAGAKYEHSFAPLAWMDYERQYSSGGNNVFPSEKCNTRHWRKRHPAVLALGACDSPES